MLNIIINYHKRKLGIMIEEKEDYNKIVKESQMLDKYINRKMNIDKNKSLLYSK